MSNFKATPIATFTKGSIVTSDESKYWKQLGVRNKNGLFKCEFNCFYF